jgi:hypothetical protein
VERHEEETNVSYDLSLYIQKNYINLKFAVCPLSLFVFRVILRKSRIHYLYAILTVWYFKEDSECLL